MEEGERRDLYMTLLRGLAQTAQDNLCAADTQHAWSKWHRTALKHDIPLLPISVEEMPVAMNETYRVKSERQCLNCGKAETI